MTQSTAQIKTDNVIAACLRYIDKRQHRVYLDQESVIEKHVRTMFGRVRSREEAVAVARRSPEWEEVSTNGLYCDTEIANLLALARLSASHGDAYVALSAELSAELFEYFRPA